MKCHICSNNLYSSIGRIDYSQNFQLNCRNFLCPMRKLVERCCLIFHPDLSKEKFSYCSFWIIQENDWYKIVMGYDKSVSIQLTSVETVKNKLISKGTKNIAKIPEGLYIYVNDDLPDKIPKLLNRIKKLIYYI